MSDRHIEFDGVAPEMRSAALIEAEITRNKFVGYAAVYGAVADLGDFTEESQRGSFRKVLAQQQQPVPFYYDHNDIHGPIAHTGGDAPTLRLGDDTKGLHVEADLPQHHPQVAMLCEQIERGEVQHMSYGFVAGRGNSKVENRGGKPHRVLTGYTALLDVSPTWRPAFSATSAELRHALLGMIPDLSQSPDGGASQQPAGEAKDPALETGAEQDEESVATDSSEQDEQRSGVEKAKAESAARRRRLHMMGISLPAADITASMGPDDPETRRRPPRDIDELLVFPRETWSDEEQRCVKARIDQVHTELFAIADKAERAGRTLNADEANEFDRLQNEFRRLCR